MNGMQGFDRLYFDDDLATYRRSQRKPALKCAVIDDGNRLLSIYGQTA
jgi:hypothetical protein